MNVVCLLGRLTADPELRRTQTDVAVTSFSVAVDRAYQPKGQERQTDFINVVAWRGTAEFICRYFHKGQRIALNGSLQSRQYTDKEGNKRTAYEVVVDNAYFAESRNAGAGAPASNANPFGSPSPAFQNEAQPAFSTASESDFEEIVGDEELPF
ncbi:MAG: single-stranded DNA-binding protein [Acutalibacteraceae bacterium]|jgi:single-strand DNA-binding protein